MTYIPVIAPLQRGGRRWEVQLGQYHVRYADQSVALDLTLKVSIEFLGISHNHVYSSFLLSVWSVQSQCQAPAVMVAHLQMTHCSLSSSAAHCPSVQVYQVQMLPSPYPHWHHLPYQGLSLHTHRITHTVFWKLTTLTIQVPSTHNDLLYLQRS